MESTPSTVVFLCPLCQTSSLPCFERHGHTIYACSKCTHRFAHVDTPPVQHVQNTYADHYFVGGTGTYPDYLRDGPMLRERGQHYADLLSRHTSVGTILDVGCAAGFILQGLTDNGWTGTGIEPNPSMARHAQQELGLNIVNAPVEQAEIVGLWDVITLFQVLPHLIDPVITIRSLLNHLHPGGLLLIETWDRKSVTARIFGRFWHEYDPPQVLHWFDRRGLRHMMESTGLQVVKDGRPARYITVDHAKTLLEHTLGTGWLAKGATFPLRLFPKTFRLPYVGDDLFWMLFRKV